MRKIKKTPAFKTEAEEHDFWEKNDSSDYVDWQQAQSVAMPNLKPSTKPFQSDYQRAYWIA